MKNDLHREHRSPWIVRDLKVQTTLSTLSIHSLRLQCNSADNMHTRYLLRLLPIRPELAAILRQTIAPCYKLLPSHILILIHHDFDDNAGNS